MEVELLLFFGAKKRGINTSGDILQITRRGTQIRFKLLEFLPQLSLLGFGLCRIDPSIERLDILK